MSDTRDFTFESLVEDFQAGRITAQEFSAQAICDECERTIDVHSLNHINGDILGQGVTDEFIWWICMLQGGGFISRTIPGPSGAGTIKEKGLQPLQEKGRVDVS